MPMTMQEWLDKANEFANLGEAERWRQANGVEVEGLPAPDLARRFANTRVTSPLASATVPAQGQAGTGSMPSNPTGGLAAMSPRDAERADLAAAYRAYPEEEAASRAAQFKAAEDRIKSMYMGPSASQTLYALGQALLAPRQFSGFGGTMYNVTRSLSGINEQRAEADRRRREALEQLRQSYETGTGDAKLKALEGRRKLVEMEDEAEKARLPKYDMNPVTGAYQTRPGTGDNLGVLTPEQVLVLKQDPRNRGKTFYTTDGRPGVF